MDGSGGGFKTVEEHIEFVLTELLREEEPKQFFTPEEEEEIKGGPEDQDTSSSYYSLLVLKTPSTRIKPLTRETR